MVEYNARQSPLPLSESGFRFGNGVAQLGYEILLGLGSGLGLDCIESNLELGCFTVVMSQRVRVRLG